MSFDYQILANLNPYLLFLYLNTRIGVTILMTYDKMSNILGPLMFSCKVLSSRACELNSVDELEEDLNHRDPEFVDFCRGFLINLKRVEQIVPFPRCWIPKGFTLIGFITSLDGGKS